MNDSTNNSKTLEEYGVWVKRPPQDSELEDMPIGSGSNFDDIAFSDSTQTDNSTDDIFDDKDEDSTLTAEELLNISDKIVTDDSLDNDNRIMQEDGNDTEVSIEDFDPPDGEISLDDFLDDEPLGTENKSKEDDVENNEPLDMDISFSDENNSDIDTQNNNEITDDFDDMFDIISNDSSGEFESEEEFNEPEVGTEESVTQEFFEETIIEDSSDNLNGLDKSSSSQVNFESETVDISDFGIGDETEESILPSGLKKDEEKIDYNLAINEDDSFDSENKLESKKSSSSIDDPDAAELLIKIAEEISGLKKEIDYLKNEFEEFKSKKTLEKSETENIENKESSGFFSNDDEDEIISLSGDELNNIMNTADFAFNEEAQSDIPEVNNTENEEIPAEQESIDNSEYPQTKDTFSNFENIDLNISNEDSSELSMNFSNEILEEPDLDEIENGTDIPEEISIPKADSIAEERENEDILVESSKTDFMDSVKNKAEADIDTEEEQKFFDKEYAEDDIFNDILPEEPSIAECLSQENFEYLEKDENPMLDEEIKTEAELESSPELPAELKEDVKSVLRYMNQLLGNLPEEKIKEFAKSEQFITYKKLFSELGLS